MASGDSVRRYSESKIPAVRHWHGTREWVTTDASDHHKATNWRNPVCLFDDPLQTLKDDVFELHCQTQDATTMSPVYVIMGSRS